MVAIACSFPPSRGALLTPDGASGPGLFPLPVRPAAHGPPGSRSGHGIIWYGLTWYGLTWYGLTWYGRSTQPY
ncbi:hypothetical protein GCM10025331_30330 [Actinoplanes utahensis]|nr:hypothetical protein Aut01nite_32050 [Actinoplanes utahensis]